MSSALLAGADSVLGERLVRRAPDPLLAPAESAHARCGDPPWLVNAIAREIVEKMAFVLPDGRLDLRKLLTDFAVFWREQGDAMVGGMTYHEVAPQLVLMAFLQKVANGLPRRGRPLSGAAGGAGARGGGREKDPLVQALRGAGSRAKRR